MPTIKHPIIASVLALSASAATAQEVELYSTDGSLSLRGPLIEFVDQKYTIDTLIGRITLDSDAVLCKGEACPEIKPPVSEISIVGVDMPARRLVAEFLPGYVQSLGAQLEKTDDPDNGTYNLTNTEDELIATVSLIDTTSSEDLSSLLQQETAIVLTSSASFTAEASELETAAPTLHSSDDNQVIALEAIAIVTAVDNPVNDISMDELAKLFSGNYTNWSELGGRDAPVKLYGPQTDSELARLFATQVFRPDSDKASRWAEDILTVENIAQQVSSDPDGIGYVKYSESQPAKTLAIKGVCGLVTPSSNFTIKAEEYPLTQRYYAYRVGQEDDEYVDAVLSYIQSDAGQDIVGKSGFVNQRDAASSINSQGFRFASAIASSNTSVAGDLLREMITGIIDSERLSFTFRFETGANKMDRRAQADVVRLAEKLLSPANATSVVQLLGFTDSVGDFELNLELSLRRANQIRDALIEIDATLAERVSVLPSGFGEIAPIACNETAQGRSINRRVEVWMGKNR